MNFVSFCLLAILFFVGAQTQEGSPTVTLQVFGASSSWWLALLPQNDNSTTSMIELQEASSSSFVPMEPNAGWGYYTLTSQSGRGFNLPLNVRLTSHSGAQITTKLNTVVPGAIIDTELQFSTTSTTTPAPTSTSAVDLCAVTPTSAEPLKLLVPLYVYPGAAWDELIAAAAQVPIIAIINPNSGPVSVVDSSYSTYMTKFADAGIEMIGYVHTSYGGRAIADVEADVSTWAANYPLITGIFFDEAASDASELAYYTQAYQFAMSQSGYSHVVLNPGVQPDVGYLDISTSIVIFEDIGANLASKQYSPWVTCAASAASKPGYKYHFTGIANTAPLSNLSDILQDMNQFGMGLVYVTDGPAGCCTYNTLTSYFAQEATSVQALN